MTVKNHLLKLLKEVISNLEKDKCELDDEQALMLVSFFSHQPLSKDMACSFLNCSRSKFDKYMRKGLLPKGRKRKGYKELVWYKDELKLKSLDINELDN